MGFYRRVVYPALVSRLGNPQPIQALREQIVPLARGDVVEASGAQICFTLPRLELVHTQRLACGHQLEQLLQQLRDRPREADQRGEHRDIAILESLPGVGRSRCHDAR
jgi:transposase